MNPPTNDFRQWIVYNPELKDDNQFYSLYKALESVSARDAFTCEKITDDDTDRFRIIQKGNEDSLLLNPEGRLSMLWYLQTHYILSDNIDQWIAQTEERTQARHEKAEEELPYFMDPQYNPLARPSGSAVKVQSRMDKPREQEPSKWFYNPVIRKHVLGYAVIAILISQVVIIPTNIFHIKLEFFKYTYSLVFFVVLHYAVRNYRNYFLSGGIRYKTVWSITFWLFLIIFGVTGYELALIDMISDGDFTFGNLIGLPLILIFAGLFIGWFFSLFVYFMNGGKVVTDPSTIKAAR
jgi:hypothetical protein